MSISTTLERPSSHVDREPEFNLIGEDWIPVFTTDGEIQRVSLSTLFTDPYRYVRLCLPEPAHEVAVFRLLVAITHSALGYPHRDYDVIPETFPSTDVLAYLEKWRDRFFLFHPTHPFLQAPHLEGRLDSKGKPVAQSVLKLDDIRTATDGRTLMSHKHVGDSDVMKPAEAAILLLTGVLFAPSSQTAVKDIWKPTPSGYHQAGDFAGKTAALPMGQTLAETLLLNLYPADVGADGRPGRPAWEIGPRMRPEGYLGELLLAKRVVLLSGNGDFVSGVSFGAGWSQDKKHLDPMVAYFKGKDGPKGIRPGAGLPWAIPATVYGLEKGATTRALTAAAERCAKGIGPKIVSVRLVGRDMDEKGNTSQGMAATLPWSDTLVHKRSSAALHVNTTVGRLTAVANAVDAAMYRMSGRKVGSVDGFSTTRNYRHDPLIPVKAALWREWEIPYLRFLTVLLEDPENETNISEALLKFGAVIRRSAFATFEAEAARRNPALVAESYADLERTVNAQFPQPKESQ